MIVARLAHAHRTAVNEQVTVRARGEVTHQRRFTARCFDGCWPLSHPLPTRAEATRVAERHTASRPEVWVITTLG